MSAHAIIRIKRSDNAVTAPTLTAGELGITTGNVGGQEGTASNNGGRLFLGTDTGNIEIGGKYYTDQLKNATPDNTNDQIVRRNSTGGFSAGVITGSEFIGPLSGNADTASALESGVNISLSGDVTGTVTGFDGSGDATIAATLADVGTPNTYGNANNIPQITTDSKGRVTSVSLVPIETEFTLSADIGSDETVSGGDTLTIQGGIGVTTNNVSTDTLQIDIGSIPNDKLINSSVTFSDGSNTHSLALGNTITVQGTSGEVETSLSGSTLTVGLPNDVTIAGDLTVMGTTTTIDTATLAVEDALIQLAKSNSADSLDIGIYGSYNDGSAKSTAFFRDQDDGEYYLVQGLTKAITNTVLGSGASDEIVQADLATLNAVIDGGTF